MIRRVSSLFVICGIIGCMTAAGAVRADEPITPAEAKAADGQEKTVEFTVKSSRFIEERKTCFLNSEKNFRDEGNFTAVIFEAGLAALAADGIDNPAEHFRDKKIRVTGKIELREDRPQIRVTKSSQIEIVKPE